jgi:YD repeat-containing protein
MLYNESSSGVAENDGRGNTHFTELDQLTGKVAGTIDTTREMDGSTKIERNVYRDAHGRVARTTEDSYWNSGFRSITWNAAGNRIEQTHSDSAGNTEKIKYDSHGRISGTVNTISIVNGNDVTERTVARDGHGKLNYSMEELLPASGLYQTHVWNGSGNMVQEYRRHADGTSEETRYRHNVSVTFNFDKNHQRIS